MASLKYPVKTLSKNPILFTSNELRCPSNHRKANGKNAKRINLFLQYLVPTDIFI